ncbi:MAG TPA: phosphoribosylformylglycinamidine synthase subunit PurQ [Kiritimatiellia bacterium]|nr:phosphoribosylformylglycinamidine synthase subunit PurQ [Kiritimatiellia bacterium]
MKPRVLILTGFGLNCEVESSFAWEQVGATVHRVHLNDLVEDPAPLREARILMFIGGFSFGDHLSSGHMFAHRIRHHLGDRLLDFIHAGGLALGVCNGFQIMTKLGLLPGLDASLTQQVALTQNDCGTFQNRWVTLGFDPASPCIFTRGLSTLDLPVRHGEGKLLVPDRTLLDAIKKKGCAVCHYLDPHTGAPTQTFPHNPNGSLEAIAGLCDPSGRCFGLMPHPEAFLFPENHPRWEFPDVRASLQESPTGLQLFQNAVDYLRQS